tara:strand:+ start:139 stop:498 length:360 start_codon:yes stop_codon:yes gene_type:complete
MSKKLNPYYCVYVVETDKYIENNWDKISVYIGMSRYKPNERFLQHRDGQKPYKKRHGKPLKLIDEFTVERIGNKILANDIERLVWFKLFNSQEYKPVQRYAPSLQGRSKYLDDYPNYPS